jgi:hypothetical protein
MNLLSCSVRSGHVVHTGPLPINEIFIMHRYYYIGILFQTTRTEIFIYFLLLPVWRRGRIRHRDPASRKRRRNGTKKDRAIA